MKKKLLNSFLLTAALLFSVGAWAEDVTFDFAANPWKHPTNFSRNAVSTINAPLALDNVVLMVKHGTGSAPYYYQNNDDVQLRVFNKNVMKIFAPTGKAVTKIVFENYSTFFNLSGDGLNEKTWTGNATYVKLAAGGSTYLTRMVVTIADINSETSTPAASADETVTIDFNDGTFPDETEFITSDINLERQSSEGEGSKVKILIPSANSVNDWFNEYKNYSFTTYLRCKSGTMVFSTDPDKIIKGIKMTLRLTGNWSASNTINGNTVTSAQIRNGVEVNTEIANMEFAGQSVIATIIITLAEKPVALDETQSNVVTSGTYNVSLKRDFNANWNTVCLPFAINDIETVFGTGAKAYDFTSYSAGTLGFTAVTELAAGHPYIVYVPAAITDDIVLYNVAVSAVNPVNTVRGDACFRGTYGPIAAGEWTKTADTDVVYGVTSDGKVQKAGATAAMKGFRAYFDIPANVEARLNFFDETTGISEMKAMRNVENETVFDLQGRRVAQPTKGLYIVNGKKVVLK